MTYGDFKDLNRRIAADKVLRDKTFDNAKNPKYDGYQRGLASMVYKLLIKKLLVVVLKMKTFLIKNQLGKYTNQLLENLIKEKYTHLLYIWGEDLADIQLISKFNEGVRFLLCVIDNYSKYAWVILLKYKKGITITNAFQKILDESNRKANKIWIDKGSEFYNRPTKSLLEKNYIETYSAHNKGKSLLSKDSLEP